MTSTSQYMMISPVSHVCKRIVALQWVLYCCQGVHFICHNLLLAHEASASTTDWFIRKMEMKLSSSCITPLSFSIALPTTLKRNNNDRDNLMNLHLNSHVNEPTTIRMFSMYLYKVADVSIASCWHDWAILVIDNWSGYLDALPWVFLQFS